MEEIKKYLTLQEGTDPLDKWLKNQKKALIKSENTILQSATIHILKEKTNFSFF